MPNDKIEKLFAEHGIVLRNIEVRSFPGETIYVVEVELSELERAMRASTSVEGALGSGNLVVVRQTKASSQEPRTAVHSINDERVSKLVELLNERSRTSEQQPSLEYIKDAAENLRVAGTFGGEIQGAAHSKAPMKRWRICSDSRSMATTISRIRIQIALTSS